MLALASHQWILLAVLAAAYLAVCLRTALHMARTRRSFWKWLIVTVLFTSIPASLVLLRQRMRAETAGRRFGAAGGAEAGKSAGTYLLCRQCGRRIAPGEADRTAGLAVCPHCGAVLEEDKLA
ncbi:MAG: hypothetical protein J7M21_01905 [Planctomycetes bacterium]|nr:hypothetical protein [Planctomycetota bacterium]